MFRVSVNINMLHSARQSAQPSAVEKSTDQKADRRGDWAQEDARITDRLTREDMCKTFSDKFENKAPHGKLDKLA